MVRDPVASAKGLILARDGRWKHFLFFFSFFINKLVVSAIFGGKRDVLFRRRRSSNDGLKGVLPNICYPAFYDRYW